MLRRIVACHLHARRHEGAAQARQSIGAGRGWARCRQGRADRVGLRRIARRAGEGERRRPDARRRRCRRRDVGRRHQRHLPDEGDRAQPLAGRTARSLVRARRHEPVGAAADVAAGQAALLPTAAAVSAQVTAPRRRHGALAVRGARGDGRRRQRAGQHRDARAGGRQARPLRDDHGLLRLRPAGADLRSADRARLAAPPRAGVHVRAGLARPVQTGRQRQPGLCGANDVVLPRRLPAGQHRRLPEVGAERRSQRSEPLLPRLPACWSAAGEHVLRRRGRARQQAVRLGDRRHQGPAGGRRGRTETALPRARPGRALSLRAR